MSKPCLSDEENGWFQCHQRSKKFSKHHHSLLLILIKCSSKVVQYILTYLCLSPFDMIVPTEEKCFQGQCPAAETLVPKCPFLMATRISPASPNFGQAKQGQKFVVPTFHIHFLNPECVRIPWVLAPENFPVENFRVRSVLQKSSIFHWFLLPPPKKKYRARVPTILMPQTFPIASLNRYTPNFSGVGQKLTWCQQFGLQIFPKWGDADICPLEMAVFRCFFGRNKFSRPNGRLSPIACHTYLESYGT